MRTVYERLRGRGWGGRQPGDGGGLVNIGKVKIEFSVVSDRGECQLSNDFYRIKKNIVHSRSYPILKS